MLYSAMEDTIEVQITKSLHDEFDDEESFLLKNGACSLILIERATEISRLYLVDDIDEEGKDRVTKIYDSLFEEYCNSDCRLLQHNLDVYFDFEEESYKIFKPSQLRSLKKRVHDKFKKDPQINKMFIQISLDIGTEAGGHNTFLMYLKNENRVYIFDSMSARSKKSKSAFYPALVTIATNIFKVKPESLTCGYNFYLQLTGGFSDNPPYALAMLPKEDFEKLRPKFVKLLKLQSTESQNHFCHVWSIWATHILISGRNIYDSMQRIINNDLDPLVVVKRYVWGLNKYFSFPSHPCYEAFFPLIWSNYVGNSFNKQDLLPFMSKHFNLYEIPMRNHFNNLDEILQFSVSPTKLIQHEPYSTDFCNKLLDRDFDCAKKQKQSRKRNINSSVQDTKRRRIR
ncbi:MAG: hypothetical protein KC414_04180 [Romboutsia sp.]|nr:hypothetical protein [Romboutsia sp.]